MFMYRPQLLHLQSALLLKQNGLVVHQCRAHELACHALSLPQGQCHQQQQQQQQRA